MMLDQLTAEEEAGGEDSQGLFSPHTHTHTALDVSIRTIPRCSQCLHRNILPRDGRQRPNDSGERNSGVI